MDYLQYYDLSNIIVFNFVEVLNLIINGLPSILDLQLILKIFKLELVLNLIINGLPSILLFDFFTKK